MTAGPVPHVELQGVTKRYGATVAVNDATLAFARGTVHALVGENGAGKSTLGKIIAGVVQPDAGELRVDGRTVRFHSPRAAIEHGITTIAQELSLVPSRSVIENVYLGIEDSTFGVVKGRSLDARFAELTEHTGIVVPGKAKARELTAADQQKVEILRALARGSQFIIMDEPTARLSSVETAGLHRTMRELAAAGRTIIFISHFLDEVLEITDQVTVMRDGRIIRTGPTATESHASLIEGMIGRSLDGAFPPRVRAAADAPEVLRVEGLTRTGVFADVSFTLRAGEIVVLAGLVGSGRTEVVRAIFGADPVSRGTVSVQGRPAPVASPGAAIGSGIAMIPESRKEQGLMLGRSARENVSLPHLPRFSRAGVVATGPERRRVAEMMEAVGVRGIGPEARVRSASGGNQQKVLFARWLLADPPVLIADEPTRGVDVGSKRTIYDLLAAQAAAGMGVLIVSSEMEEVLGMAHRILVMRNGRLVADIDGETATEEIVVALAFGTVPPALTA
jgi:simple sugar transport system ATP-binding protein/ribose transport system ATP-binding protein